MKKVHYNNLNSIDVYRKLLITTLTGISVMITPVALAETPSRTTINTKSKATVSDQTLERNINSALSDQVPDGSFTVASYGQHVLLAGQVQSTSDKNKAVKAVASVVGVKKIWNYLTIEPNEGIGAISNDAYLTSRVKAKLVAQNGVNTMNIKVVTSNKIVYLLGKNAGAPRMVEAGIENIKGIEDVKHVVNLIDQ